MWQREDPNSRAEYERWWRGQVVAQEQRDKLEHQQSESAETAQCHVELEQQQIEPERPNTEIKSQPSEQPEAKQRRTERWRLSPGRVFFLALALWLAITMVAKEVSLNDEVYVSMVCLSGLVLLYFASVVSVYWVYWRKR
jgi:hypothetical protein